MWSWRRWEPVEMLGRGIGRKRVCGSSVVYSSCLALESVFFLGRNRDSFTSFPNEVEKKTPEKHSIPSQSKPP
jgi:hypothetical protein